MSLLNCNLIFCPNTFLYSGRQGFALYKIVLNKAALFSPENEFSVIDVSKPWQPDVLYDTLPKKN
jgi:hypothetical protein